MADPSGIAGTAVSASHRHCSEELVNAWQRQKEAHEWQELKLEIDSMIEERIPLDLQKEKQILRFSRNV